MLNLPPVLLFCLSQKYECQTSLPTRPRAATQSRLHAQSSSNRATSERLEREINKHPHNISGILSLCDLKMMMDFSPFAGDGEGLQASDPRTACRFEACWVRHLCPEGHQGKAPDVSGCSQTRFTERNLVAMCENQEIEWEKYYVYRASMVGDKFKKLNSFLSDANIARCLN